MSIRTFIAFEIDPDPRLRRVIDQLDLVGSPVRISRMAGLHLTLKFLGDTAQESVSEVTEIMNDLLVNVRAIDRNLKGLGVFPNLRRPTVVWAGVHDAEPISVLHSRLETRLLDVGFDRDRRPWTPHVTLARINPRKPVPETLLELLRRYAERDFGHYRFDRVVLYQSQVGVNGPEYRPLHSVSLE